MEDPRECTQITCPFDHRVSKIECIKCPEGMIQDDKNPRGECVKFHCGRRERKDLKLSTCVACNDYEVPDIDVGMTKCVRHKCSKTSKVTYDGYCEECPRREY